MAVVNQREGESSQRESEDDFEALAREFGVQPGVPRHGQVGLRWSPGEVSDMQVRDAEDEAEVLEPGSIANLRGHFARFGEWTEIDSFFEGRFMESVAPGAFKKTFSENLKGMRCLFQHGRDSQVDMKPLGPIRSVAEDEEGARYHVPMLDTSYNRDLLPGLKAGLYGASFRFQVIQEEVNAQPERSEWNPEGIEERVVKEAKVREFGPVTFPAYENATAGVRSGMRSLNDLYLELDLEMFAEKHPNAYPMRLAQLLHHLRTAGRGGPPPVASIPPPVPESSTTPDPQVEPVKAVGLRSTRLTTPRGPLRTSRNMEDPSWKL